MLALGCHFWPKRSNAQKERGNIPWNSYCFPCYRPLLGVLFSIWPMEIGRVKFLFMSVGKWEWILMFSFFFLTSLLEYNCFTMVCYFLLYNKVNQLYIYICSPISSLLHLPPSHPPYPTPLGGHKAPN